MTQIVCHQCGLMPEDLNVPNPRDYFTPTGNGNEIQCTTCVLHNAARDAREPSGARLTKLIVAARENARWWASRCASLKQENTRLTHAEDFCALMADHLKGCVATPDEDAALREWHYAAGIQEVPEDDHLRSEL